MGLKLSKVETKPNPLVDSTFDGESSDYTQTADTYQHPFGPEWVFGKNEVNTMKQALKDLDESPDDVPVFSLKGRIVPAKCVKVYDGDTAHFVFQHEGEWIRKRFRMLGYNSPEMRGGSDATRKAAKEARDYLASRLLGQKVLLYLGDFDKYGRPLCEIYLADADNLSVENAFQNHLNEEMVEKGYGERYMSSREFLFDTEWDEGEQ